jgi:hypothetical protein
LIIIIVYVGLNRFKIYILKCVKVQFKILKVNGTPKLKPIDIVIISFRFIMIDFF